MLSACLAFLWGYIAPPASQERSLPDLYEAGLTELQQGLEEGHFTSFHLVKVISVGFLRVSVAEAHSDRHIFLASTK
jgi:hypothetical protein